MSNQKPNTTRSNVPAQQQQQQQKPQTAQPSDRDVRSEALAALRNAFETQRAEIVKVLPAQIPFERFKRVVDTAVLRTPDLLIVPPRELFMACMQAASDGLLPDGREGALVIFNMKDGKTETGQWRWRKAVQWMPMIAGLLKKIRNSGELATIVAKMVYAGDKFRNWIDDDGEHIEYEAGDEQDRDHFRCVFAMAKLKDGSVEVEVLKPADIEKIRAVSRTRDSGPWVDWFDQMCCKSAIRRLSKRLPMSTDLDDLIRRDDALYDLEGAADQRATPQIAKKESLAGKLDMLAGAPTRTLPPHDKQTGEIIDHVDQMQDQQHQGGDDRAPAETTTNPPASEGQKRTPPVGEQDAPERDRTEDRSDPPQQDDRRDPPQDHAMAERQSEHRQNADDHPNPQAQRTDPEPTPEDRARMEYEAEILSIGQTKAQKGARSLKLWLWSLDADDYAAATRMKGAITSYLPQGEEYKWPVQK